jgi:hypothetical protein
LQELTVGPEELHVEIAKVVDEVQLNDSLVASEGDKTEPIVFLAYGQPFERVSIKDLCRLLREVIWLVVVGRTIGRFRAPPHNADLFQGTLICLPATQLTQLGLPVAVQSLWAVVVPDAPPLGRAAESSDTHIVPVAVDVINTGAVGHALLGTQIALLVSGARSPARLTIIRSLPDTGGDVGVASLTVRAIVIAATSGRALGPNAHLPIGTVVVLNAVGDKLHTMAGTTGTAQAAVLHDLALTPLGETLTADAEGAEITLEVVGADPIVHITGGVLLLIATASTQPQQHNGNCPKSFHCAHGSARTPSEQGPDSTLTPGVESKDFPTESTRV